MAMLGTDNIGYFFTAFRFLCRSHPVLKFYRILPPSSQPLVHHFVSACLESTKETKLY